MLQASPFMEEDYQFVILIVIPICKSLLANPDHLFLFHMSRRGFQD